MAAPFYSLVIRVAGISLSVLFLTFGGLPAAKAQTSSSATADVGQPICEHPKADGKLLIITIDGVRWQEVFLGADNTRTTQRLSAHELTPNLHALGERGAFVGAPEYGTISATGPHFVSFPGYAELFAGHVSPCQMNTCTRVSGPTLFDEAWMGGEKVAVFSSWKRIDFAATSTPYVQRKSGFGRSCGDEREGRLDSETTEAALAYYERERPEIFFFGLAGTDEAAHHGDYDGYLASLHQADAAIGRLVALADPAAHIFVTADHGRASNFRDHGSEDSGRVWMVAAGPKIAARGEVVSLKPRHLADIAPTARQLLHLPADHSDGAGEVMDELFDNVATAD